MDNMDYLYSMDEMDDMDGMDVADGFRITIQYICIYIYIAYFTLWYISLCIMYVIYVLPTVA